MKSTLGFSRESIPRRWAAALGLAALSLSVTVQRATAQGTLADYQRAERLLDWNTTDLLAGVQVNPNWLRDGNRFWYRNNTGSGYEFNLVDPVRGTKAPVFDHARLAAAMMTV